MEEKNTTTDTLTNIQGDVVVDQAVTTKVLPMIDLNKWSWGGLMNPMMAVIASRRYAFLGLFVFYFIPFLNFIAIPVIHIYFGIKARRFIADHEQAFVNDTERDGFIRGFDRVGTVMAIITAAIIGLVVAGFLILGAGMFAMMDEMSPADQAEFESVFEEIEREFEAEMGGDLEMDPMIETDVVNKVTE